MIYFQQCHVKCHGINKDDLNYCHLSNLLATCNTFLPSGILKLLHRNDILRLMVHKLQVDDILLKRHDARWKNSLCL